jgi:hypothetical protein
MPSLDSSIDQLYRGPLSEFVAARNALAKTLKGEDATQVRQLQKPTSVAWAVNQLYWQNRSVYDRLVKSGAKLRAAQIGALGGQRADVRGAGEQHRVALGEALAETARLAAEGGLKPNGDELSRTFEALSLGAPVGEPPGRLTKGLQLAGFEALAGVQFKAPPAPPKPRDGEESRSASVATPRKPSEVRAHQRKEAEAGRRLKEAEAERERREAEAHRRRTEAIAQAREAVARARTAEERAKSEWERTAQVREAAERALADLESASR